MTDGPPVLDATGLSKLYRRGPEEVHALRDASLRIDAGEIVALVGPSGSGKTTLLSVLAGWETADRGGFRFMGREVVDATSLDWADLAIVPQTFGLVEELSVRENVQLPTRLGQPHPGGTPERVDHLLADLGLVALADRLPAEVSLGEQQRTALARALVLRPRLLMADEPTGQQDAGWTRGVVRALQGVASEGTACLIATHHRALVRYADRVLAIHDGSVEQVPAASVVAEGDEL